VRLLLGSALAAAIVSGVIWTQRPTHLDLRTDIVGYPTVNAFDPRPRTWSYYLIVVAFPLLTLAFYALSVRLARRWGSLSERSPSWAVPLPSPPSGADEPESSWKTWPVVLLRVGLVGASLGWEVAIATRSERVGLVTMAATAGYLLLIAALAWLVGGFRGRATSPRAMVASLNALAAPMTVLGLYAVSRATRVTVRTDQSVHHYQWLPLWLAIALSGLAIGVVVHSLGRSPRRDPWRTERQVLLLVVGPVLVFLAFATLPGAAGTMDAFESGQWLVGARYLMSGGLPYRDFVGIHGPLLDGLVAVTGLTVIQNSFWGVLAGIGVIVVPIYWVMVYYLNAYLFRKNVVFIASTILVVLAGASLWGGLMAQTNVRMMFVPLMLLAFAWLLARPSRIRAYLFVGVSLLHVFLTPEVALAIPGFAIVLVVYEYHYRSREAAFHRSFRRVLLCAESGLVYSAIALVVLGAAGVLGPMIDHFRTFSSGHSLTGAFPIPPEETPVVVARFLFPILLLASFWFVVARIRRRSRLELADWVMSADAIFVLLYYPKFYGRPDEGHFFEAWTIAVPLVFYVVYRLIDGAEHLIAGTDWGRATARWTSRHFVTAAVALALLVPVFGHVADRFDHAPERFDQVVASEPSVKTLGYAVATRPAVVDDVKTVIGAVTDRDDQVFDFTNAPGFFYYELGYDSPTPYYHVSTAIRSDTQADLIDDLRRANPVVVAYEGGPGLYVWDGIPNSVRHYDVSYYILTHFRPLALVDSVLLFVRNDVHVPMSRLTALPIRGRARFTNLYAAAGRCSWGLFADVSDQHPAASARSVELEPRTSRQSDGSYLETLRLPPDARDYRWLEITTDGSFVPDQFFVASDGNPSKSISFSTDDRSPNRYLVQVGACALWWGFDTPNFGINHQHPQNIRSVRLIQ
jgi:hypothetical protein